jgi:transcriptional regulator with XRE-family HTH domain
VSYLFADVATFGSNLKRLREERTDFKTKKSLAAALGVASSVVSRWENDVTGLPETPTLLKLSKLLNCSVEELLIGIDPDYDALRATFRDRANTETAHGEPTLAVTAEQSETGWPGASVAGLTGDDGRETSPDRRQAEAVADLAELEFDEVANAIQSLVDILIERHRLATTPRGRPSKARSKQTPRPDRARA